MTNRKHDFEIVGRGSTEKKPLAKRLISFIALSFVLLVMIGETNVVEAGIKKQVYPTATSFKITWSKNKKASKYVVMRRSSKKGNNEGGNYKKVKTLKKSAVSFTDKKLKKGRYYDYEIWVYDAKGRMIDEMDAAAFIGVARPVWDDYLTTDVTQTNRQITLKWYFWSGMRPSSVTLYRRDITKGESDYKKLTTVKCSAKKKNFTYIDKKVESGHLYEYRIKGYKKVGGKKKYSKYSESVRLRAVLTTPKLTLKVIRSLSSNGELIFSLANDRANAELKFTDLNDFEIDDVDIEDLWVDRMISITAFSKDGRSWTSCGSTLTIPSGATYQIKMKLNSDMMPYRSYVPGYPTIRSAYSLVYNDHNYTFAADLNRGIAEARVNLELYH